MQAEVRVKMSAPEQVGPVVSRPKNQIGSSVLSSDSGLSSIRIESEVTDSEILEFNGLKKLLIDDIEKAEHNFTKVIYHYNKEKFIVRVVGKNPTLGQFLMKFHDYKISGKFDFIFKTTNDEWVEINDENQFLPIKNQLVEVRIVESPLVQTTVNRLVNHMLKCNSVKCGLNE